MNLVLYVKLENVIKDIDKYNIISFHGYTYTDVAEKNTRKPSKFETTTNGYYAKTDLKRTKSKIVIPNYYIDGYRRVKYNYYDSLIRFLSSLKRFKKRYNIDKVIIKTDNVDFGRIIKTKNQDLKELFNGYYKNNTDYIVELKEILKIKIIRVYTGNLGLDLANEALIISANTRKEIFFRLTDIKYYWTPEKRKVKNKGDFIIAKHLIFKNTRKTNIPYCFCNYKKDDNVGLQTNYVAYYQYYTKNGLDDINVIRTYFNDMLSDLEVICTIDTELFYDKTSERLKLVYGNEYLIKEFKHNKAIIKRPDDAVIASEIKPVGIAGHGMSNCSVLSTIMRSFVNYLKSSVSNNHYIEVTDKIYDNNKIKKEIDNKYKLTLDLTEQDIKGVKNKNKYKIKLISGIDYPDRNTLKRIEKLKPRVFMCFNTINEKVFEYYSIIFVEETEEIIVWSNVYSNKLPYKPNKR